MGTLSNYTVFSTGFALEVAMYEFSTPTEVYIPANDYTIGDSKSVKQGQLLKVTPLQMHFHTVSEHTMDGANSPAELHIVTKVDDGESDYCDRNSPCLAVFGIMLNYCGEGKEESKAFKKLFSKLPTAAGKENGVKHEDDLNLDDFLPKDLDYYTYLGSLTTPPCTEIVTWHVFDKHVCISTASVDDHQSMVAFAVGDDCAFTYGGICTPPREKTNHRNVQPYNGRKFYKVKI